MFDNNRKHALTLHDSLQKSFTLLQKNNIIDANLKVITKQNNVDVNGNVNVNINGNINGNVHTDPPSSLSSIPSASAIQELLPSPLQLPLSSSAPAPFGSYGSSPGGLYGSSMGYGGPMMSHSLAPLGAPLGSLVPLENHPQSSGISNLLVPPYDKAVIDAIRYGKNLKNQRKSSMAEFRTRLNNNDNADNDNNNNNNDKTNNDDSSSSWPLDSVTIIQSDDDYASNTITNNTTSSGSGNKIQQLTPIRFKQKYLYSNLPCLIHDLNEQEFKSVSTNWVKKETVETKVAVVASASASTTKSNDDDGDNNDNNDGDGDNNDGTTTTTACSATSATNATTATAAAITTTSCIDTEWFLNEIGRSTLVPVRKQPQLQSQKENEVVEGEEEDYDSDKHHDKHGSTSTDEDEDEDDVGLLDEDGRATECETIEMNMEDWIERMKNIRNKNNDNGNDNNDDDEEKESVDPNLYLKDWHLQNIIEDRWSVVTEPTSIQRSSSSNELSSCLHQNCENEIDIHENENKDRQELNMKNFAAMTATSTSATNTNITNTPKKTLYTIPKIFAGDVFNPFLLANGGGDYRFVYWGPKGSHTSIHSDVLHTFSWSFNVFGEKKWVFYPPSSTNNDDNDIGSHKDTTSKDSSNVTSDEIASSFEIIQKTGETIYVPSGWKHSVHNLQETLSINHNWMTSSTLDEMYKCILCEIKAIDKELMNWGMLLNADDNDNDNDNDCDSPIVSLELFRIREDMLRGCVGLDVTSFCVMILGCLSDCFDKILRKESKKRKAAAFIGISNIHNIRHDLLWEYWFDFTCIVNVLNNVLEENAGVKSKNLMLRLCAMLGKDVGMNFMSLLSSLSKECNNILQEIAG
jgi:hypothetical protein